ncbi:hypothetical protein [Pseudonocardia sp. 73-21]|uniref:hypothetical protein n=1 Tax=Pseudonocardia sp. 73-21 TaxID=1895809 RepID=UPI002610112D|nr:hypothetical protein [Pseudonocardia sp. 73-21]
MLRLARFARRRRAGRTRVRAAQPLTDRYRDPARPRRGGQAVEWEAAAEWRRGGYLFWRRLYVAAESGWVSLLELHDRRLSVVGSDHLADGAHVVAVDELTHHSFYPLPAGADGHPALLEAEPLS